MPYNPDIHHRRSIRLDGYDYRQDGAYFITLCTHGRENILGNIDEAELFLNTLGCIVEEEWQNTPVVRPYVELDLFVVMPNHFHGILVINHAPSGDDGDKSGDVAVSGKSDISGDVGATWQVAWTDESVANSSLGEPADTRAMHRIAPTTTLQSGSIGAMIGQFKALTTKRINKTRLTSGAPVWQRNYYEHIIRSAESLSAIREYILYNPARWKEDSLYQPPG